MSCNNCIEVKDQPLTYTKCEQCGGWRKLEPQEQAKIVKRKKPRLLRGIK
jgi:hypothetical protein